MRPGSPGIAAVAAVQGWMRSVDLAQCAPRHGARMLALAYLCDLIGAQAGDAAPMVPLILEQLPVPDLAEGSVLAGLLASAAMLGQAHVPGARDHAAAYIEVVDGALAGASAWAAGIAALALHGSAAAPASPAAYCPDQAKASRRLLRSGTGADLDAVLCMLEGATLFGTHRVAVDPLLATLLEGVAMAALRRYELCLGMRCMRALRYIGGHGGLALQMGMDFVHANDGTDGGFGDYAAVVSLHPQVPHLALDLKLSATFDSLWTIAEDDASFRLVERAFGSRGLLAM